KPKALVPSKRTASLSSFPNVHPSVNPYTFKPNNNANTNPNYMSLNRNSDTQQLRHFNQQYAIHQQNLRPQFQQVQKHVVVQHRIPLQYSQQTQLRPQYIVQQRLS